LLDHLWKTLIQMVLRLQDVLVIAFGEALLSEDNHSHGLSTKAMGS
jgi:hypothetical protein